MDLRPYQQSAIVAVSSGWSEWQRQLIVLPTGAGKTIVFSSIVADEPGRSLVIAHREELVDQAIEKLHKARGVLAQKEKANHRASLTAKTVVASVQTLGARLTKWPADHFSLVVVDEAHHALAATWKKVIDHFCGGGARLLGVTATPDRGDKKALAEVFENVAFEVNLVEMVRDGFLCPIRVQHLPVEVDLNKVRTQAGDFRADDAGLAVGAVIEEIADATVGHAWDRKLIVFLPLCKESENFATLLNARGIESRHIAGDSPDRAEILRWFAEPGPKALCNASLLLEGFDQPDVDAVLMLRPTKVRSLYAQAIGRGTRLAEGKDHLLILDPLWLTGRHDLVRPASLVAKSKEEADAATQAMLELGGMDLLEGVAAGRRSLEEQLTEELAKLERKPPKGQVDALAWSLAIRDTDLEGWEPTMKWHKQPASPAQISALQKAGFWSDSITCKGLASLLLDKLSLRRGMKLATPKQLLLLIKLGHPNPDLETFDGASEWIDKALGGRRAA